MNLSRYGPSSLRIAWIMLGWLLAVQIAVAIVGRSLAPLGALIGTDIELTNAQIGLLPAALYLGQLFIGLPSGFISDKWGSRHLLLILGLVLGFSFVFFSFSYSLGLILVFLFVGGLGFGTIHTTTNLGIVYWFPLKRRGTAMGIKQMGMTFGSALASLILLPIAIQIGWRLAILIASLLLITISIFAFIYYRDSPEKNVAGTPKLTIQLFLRRLKEIIRNKTLWKISLSAAGLSGIQISWNTFIIIYAHDKFQMNLAMAGLLLVFSEVSGSFGRIAWGVISDFIFNGNRKIIFMIIALLTFITSVTVAVLPSQTPLFIIFFISCIFGFCVSGFNGIWMNMASESTTKNLAGTATGFSLMIGSLGIVLVPPLFGWIVDKTSTYEFAWFSLGGLSLLILLLSFFTRRLSEVKGAI
ncbi:MFS transporter [Sporosarcina sp. ACRSL]|uniref:MFS transporter n=1 Tax=Sporosarcina sp. ACRSL TaxID=2918215 RepID=UPI001EF5CF86|nr:MFS transporter [Sporosarcina sp. ACRSL]MCG7344009.1 MFS transporter [Sporosarcina sp. ACRSL]